MCKGGIKIFSPINFFSLADCFQSFTLHCKAATPAIFYQYFHGYCSEIHALQCKFLLTLTPILSISVEHELTITFTPSSLSLLNFGIIWLFLFGSIKTFLELNWPVSEIFYLLNFGSYEQISGLFYTLLVPMAALPPTLWKKWLRELRYRGKSQFTNIQFTNFSVMMKIFASFSQLQNLHLILNI